MDQDGSGEDGKDYDYAYTLKVGIIIGFAGPLNVRYEKKEESIITSRFFYLSYRTEVVSI